MTWDLREQVLLATWAEQGHEFRTMSTTGAVCCLRCETIIHLRSRARALGGSDEWPLADPAVVRPCKPTTHKKEHL